MLRVKCEVEGGRGRVRRGVSTVAAALCISFREFRGWSLEGWWVGEGGALLLERGGKKKYYQLLPPK